MEINVTSKYNLSYSHQTGHALVPPHQWVSQDDANHPVVPSSHTGIMPRRRVNYHNYANEAGHCHDYDDTGQ